MHRSRAAGREGEDAGGGSRWSPPPVGFYRGETIRPLERTMLDFPCGDGVHALPTVARAPVS
ncbi:hypothetical protein GCM10010299_10310 [Streptomyces tanashiensis]|nr:hypothetical protein GCM10010299_10310 [Streptomyces tanashiensis]